MEYNVEMTRGITIVTPACSHIDTTNYKILQKALEDSLASTNDLLLDMQVVDFIDSTGIGELLAIRKKVQAANGQFRICGIKNSVRESFELVHLHNIIPLYETRQIAMAEPGIS